MNRWLDRPPRRIGDWLVLTLAAGAVLTAVRYLPQAAGAAGRLLGRGPAFWAGAGLGGAFLMVGGLAALDFDKAFVVFHALFFPGKDNWLFDPRTDEIITILPQEFFMNCALLILAILIVGCAALVAGDLILGSRRAEQENDAPLG